MNALLAAAQKNATRDVPLLILRTIAESHGLGRVYEPRFA